MAGFSTVNLERKSGVLAQIDRQGATGIAFVNVGKSPATVNLFAHENSGAKVATQKIELQPFQKLVKTSSLLFEKNIAKADYLRFESDATVVGFQVNSSADGTMLDALPAM